MRKVVHDRAICYIRSNQNNCLYLLGMCCSLGQKCKNLHGRRMLISLRKILRWYVVQLAG